MRQVASVIKDGQVRYFIADTEEGELSEFATIAVSDSFDPTAAIKLGFNLIAAVGLNGHRPAATGIRAVLPAKPSGLPAASPRGQWVGTPTAIDYVASHPGCRIVDIAEHFRTTVKAVASAVTRGAATHDIVRRNGLLYPPANGRPSIMDVQGSPPPPPKAGGPTTKRGAPRRRARAEKKEWAVTVEQVVDYIRGHPRCSNGELCEALLGEPSREHRQVISNRIMVIVERGKKGDGPVLDKEHVPNPSGGVGIVLYRLVEEADDDATLDLRVPELD